MRTIKVVSLFAILVSLLVVTPSQAFLADVEFIDFSGWDHTLIDNGPGQTFTDVFPFLPGPAIDVTVAATGDFSRESKFTAGFINDALLNPNDADNFKFTFSRSIPNLVVRYLTVDSQEALDIIGVGPETNFHNDGAVPNILPIGGAGIAIIGNGVGQNPLTGASSGDVTTGAQMGLPVIVRHRNLGTFIDKFEYFKIGTFVPEPGSTGLLAFGLIGLLGLRKRG